MSVLFSIASFTGVIIRGPSFNQDTNPRLFETPGVAAARSRDTEPTKHS